MNTKKTPRAETTVATFGDVSISTTAGAGNAADPVAPVKFGVCSLSALKRTSDASAPKGFRAEWTPTTADIRAVCEQIKNGKWADVIDRLRKEPDAARRKRMKTLQLPRLDVAGNYALGCAEKDVLCFSGFFALDFDAKDNPTADWSAIFDVLAALPWTLAVFKSASGNGLKAIIRSSTPDEAIVSGSPVRGKNIERDFYFVENFLKGIFPNLVADGSNAALRHTYVSADADAFVLSRHKTPHPLGTLENTDEFGNKHAPDIATLCKIYKPLIENVWSAADGKYVEALSSEKEFVTRTESQIWRIFLTCGFPKMRKDALCLYLAQQRHLTRVERGHVGFPAGVFRMSVGRVAVERGPDWIFGGDGGRSGSWENIRALCAALFDDPNEPRQIEILFAWLQRARRRIRAHLDARERGEMPPELYCPALGIMGEQATGKTSFYKTIIRPLLGGRDYDAKKILALGERFNGGIVGSEILLIDDIPQRSVAAMSREGFGDNIKSFLFSANVAIESKFHDEFALEMPCFVAVQLYNSDSILSTPSPERVWDKMIHLHCSRFRELEEETPEDWRALNKAIAEELPAFARFLDDEYKLPDDIAPHWDKQTERRIGMIHFVHPAVAEEQNMTDPALVLLDAYDRAAARSTYSGWYGTQKTSAEIGAAAGMQNRSAISIGQLLRTLSERDDTAQRVARISRASATKGCAWIISAP